MRTKNTYVTRGGEPRLRTVNTVTTVHGTTTLQKTDNELVDGVLASVEDAVSFLYYSVLENQYAGHQTREDARRDALAALETAVFLLKEGE